jgi:hypothetical protein
MFQMATKYRGRYCMPYKPTAHQNVVRQTERLGASVVTLARLHLHAGLSQMRSRLKELDAALSLQQRKW